MQGAGGQIRRGMCVETWVRVTDLSVYLSVGVERAKGEQRRDDKHTGGREQERRTIRWADIDTIDTGRVSDPRAVRR